MSGVLCFDWKSNAYCWSDLRFSAVCTMVIKDLNPLTQVAAVSESLATRSRLLFAWPWIIEKQQSSLSIGGRCGSLACFFSACRPARLKISRISNSFETYDHNYVSAIKTNPFSSLAERLLCLRYRCAAWSCAKMACDSVRRVDAYLGY